MKTSARICLVVLSLLMIQVSPVLAQESTLDTETIVGEADKLKGPSDDSFEIQPPVVKAPWDWRAALKDAPAFIRDTTLKINVRSFYFARQDGADEPGNDKEKISWAIGGSAFLKTGKLYDVFSIGAEVFTSQKLYGPDDKDGALILGTGQDAYTVLGVLNPRFDHQGHALSLYRQRHDLPYVNNQENRMTPNTFESYSYAYLGEGEKPTFQIGLGYLDKIKKRNSDEFVSMSEAAGVDGGERGMPWLGVRVRPVEDLKLSAVNYAGIDFLNIFYSDLEFSHKLSDDWALKSSAQFSEQRSIGDDLLTDESFSTSMWGLQQAVSFRKFLVRAAVTVNDETTALRSPYGSYPGFNSAIVEDFLRAGEVAWKIGLAYDFAGIGWDGFSSYFDFIQGQQAVDEAGQSLPDKNETDFNLDYRIKDGRFKNFWLRFRAGFVHEDTVGTTKDFRIILNYDLPVI